MVKGLKVLGIIPARGGSKGIPKKNIYPLVNHPLIAYSISNSKNSKYLDRTIVSTDNEDIANISIKYGADVPFFRPKELSEDSTTDYPVILHALNWLKDNDKFVPDLIVQLRPTSPLRPKNLIDDSITDLIKNNSADSLRGVVEASQTPFKMWYEEDSFLLPILGELKNEYFNMPRQKLKKTFFQTGHIDIIKKKTILEKKSLTGQNIVSKKIDLNYCVDIDSEEDLNRAKKQIVEGRVDICIPFLE